jgi:hypothetical protein
MLMAHATEYIHLCCKKYTGIFYEFNMSGRRENNDIYNNYNELADTFLKGSFSLNLASFLLFYVYGL